MTISNSPKAEQQEESLLSKEDEVKNQMIDSIQTLDALESLYTNNITRTEELNNSSKGVNTGPWKNISAAKIPAGQDKIFDYMLSGPSLILILSFINKYPEFNYNNIFNIGLTRLQEEAGVRQLLTQAQAELETFNIKGYQDSVLLAKDILYKELLNKVEVYVNIVDLINKEINNINSIIYKNSDVVYGPFSPQQIATFRLPNELIEIRNSTTSIISEIKNLFNKLDKLANIPEDVLVRVNLGNIGLIQSTEDPNILNLEQIEEKDPWGIRFSYTRSVSGSRYIDGINTDNNARANRTLTQDNQTRENNSFIETPDSLNSKTVNEKRNFYFQLLPAIKSNLPVSAGTDAPGALPGVQFRIENNIIKHRIPGFAPIYQPLGIDSIKCTLVGMFTGNDGVDISSAYSDDLNTGLLLPDKNAAFGSRNLSNNFMDGSNIPIPSQSKSTTSSNVAVLSEDAFRGAQDFYNEVVAPAQEIEVELNLRKGSMNFAGGAPGPFRDELTGNPRFKALIKKLDLYYVRRDRCWFILDLEITNSGLIGNKCINLTNTIEEAVDLFESIEDEPTGLTKEQLDKCFVDPIEMKYKNEKSGYALVIDRATGLSYEYRLDNKTLKSEGVYPTSTIDTLQLLRKDIANINFGAGSLTGANKKSILKLIVSVLVNSTESVKTNPNDNSFNFATNKVKVFGSTDIITQGESIFAVYNKNDGLFYTQDKKGNLEGRYGTFTPVIINSKSTKSVNKKTLKEIHALGNKGIDYSSVGFNKNLDDVDQSLRFFLDEYLPLVVFKPNSCEKLQVSNKKQEISKDSSLNPNKVSNSPETINSNFNELKKQSFFKKEDGESLDNLKISVSNGDYNTIITEALKEAISLMQGNSINEPNSNLTKGLINVITEDFNSKRLFIKTDNNINIIVEFIQLDTTRSTEKDLYCTFKYNLDKPATLIVKKRQYNLGPTRRPGTLKIQTFSRSGLTIYKINTINLLPN